MHDPQSCGRSRQGGRSARHPAAMQVHWQQLAEWQAGLVSRRQLNAAGIDRWRVRNQVTSGRWMTVGPRVVALFTGDLTWEQRSWAGHLHAGPASMIGGLASA